MKLYVTCLYHVFIPYNHPHHTSYKYTIMIDEKKTKSYLKNLFHRNWTISPATHYQDTGRTRSWWEYKSESRRTRWWSRRWWSLSWWLSSNNSGILLSFHPLRRITRYLPRILYHHLWHPYCPHCILSWLDWGWSLIYLDCQWNCRW